MIDADTVPVEITLRVPSALHARYLALVSTGLYVDCSKAVAEALRTHLRSNFDAAHYDQAHFTPT